MKINIDDIEPVAHDLMRHCQQKLGFKDPPGLFFAEDGENGDKLLGKTAYYDPSNKDVVVFITNRHGKDVLRSIAHELVHHMQNLRGDFDTGCETTPGYAQANPKLRKMEAEAYLLGNMLFRDWEDGRKSKKLQEQKEKFTMKKSTIKKMIKEEIMRILNEDVKNPIEEECEECPDVQKEALGQHSKAKSLKDIPGRTSDPEYVDPELTSAIEAELTTGIDPTLDPGYEASQPMGRDWKLEAEIERRLREGASIKDPAGSAQKSTDFDQEGTEVVPETPPAAPGAPVPVSKTDPWKEERIQKEGCGDDPEELEEDLNEGDPDSDASQTLFTGIKSKQGEADAERKKEEEEEAAKKKKGDDIRAALMGGISQGQHAHSQATAAEKKTKYRGSSYANESATVRTPEIENALYESRFTSRDTKLFKKLVGKWTK